MVFKGNNFKINVSLYDILGIINDYFLYLIDKIGNI